MDLKASGRIGLGCWALGGDQWGSQDDQTSLATIQRAFEAGIRHFDTAQGYGRGHGEELVGKALHGNRAKSFIATKIFYLPQQKVQASIESSLKRLQTDYIDLLYIHWPKKGGDLAGMIAAFEQARSKGVIRYIGVSNFSKAQIDEAGKAGQIDAVQLGYNLLWRKEESETIPGCAQAGIPLVTYSSLAEGILSGKFGRQLDFPQEDHRKYTLLFKNENWPRVFDVVEKLKSIAAEANRPLSHLAIRWLLSRPEISTVLVGSRSPEQVAHNITALEGNIAPSVLEEMTRVSDDLSQFLPNERNIFGFNP